MADRESVTSQENKLREHIEKLRTVLREAKEAGVVFRVTGGTRRPYQIKASIK